MIGPLNVFIVLRTRVLLRPVLEALKRQRRDKEIGLQSKEAETQIVMTLIRVLEVHWLQVSHC